MIYRTNRFKNERNVLTPSFSWRVLIGVIARGLALFFGGFSLLNLLGEIIVHGFDANNWWINFQPAPHIIVELALFVFGVLLFGFGVGVRTKYWRLASLLVCIGVLGVIGNNVRVYYLARAQGAFFTAPCVPISLFLFIAVLFIFIGIWFSPIAASSGWERLVLIITLFASMVGFPLAQIFLFGNTDYRRPADVIVVLGAQAFADGSCSIALTDRVRTACLLYYAGLAPRLIMSGGPSPGGMTEPEAMRRLAVSMGVPNSAILLDTGGHNTHATVRDTTAMFTQFHMRRVLVVSHFFHLPRIKMAYQRAGWNIYSVPVDRPQLSNATLHFEEMREVAGLWSYYLCPLWGHSDD